MAKDTIATMAIRGSAFSIVAAGITMVSGFVRSVLLARLLLPEQFGVVTLALFFLSLTTQVQRFGLNEAFVQQQNDSPIHLATFAALRIGLTAIAVAIALIAAPILARLYPAQPGLAPVVIALAILELVKAFNAVPETILSRNLHFRRLALLDVASSLLMTLVAPLIAWLGGGVWALVAEKATGILVSAVGLWLYQRPWLPVFDFDREIARWYLDFGKFIFANANLSFLLDQFDDFWIGTFLGVTALGFYSRAYEFARYPRRVLSGPLVKVFFPTFAQLQNDRSRLSKAFYRVCSLIVRIGFPTFGAFALIVPEFIQIILGQKWLPMTIVFRLMLVYTLLNPLVAICYNLLNAVGQPQRITNVRLVQTSFFIPAVIVLAHLYEINGVAVATDLMIILGVILLFKQAKRYVDFSSVRMILVPSLALGLGSVAALEFVRYVRIQSAWGTLLYKVIISTLLYFIVLFVFEQKKIIRSARLVWKHLHTHK